MSIETSPQPLLIDEQIAIRKQHLINLHLEQLRREHIAASQTIPDMSETRTSSGKVGEGDASEPGGGDEAEFPAELSATPEQQIEGLRAMTQLTTNLDWLGRSLPEGANLEFKSEQQDHPVGLTIGQRNPTNYGSEQILETTEAGPSSSTTTKISVIGYDYGSNNGQPPKVDTIIVDQFNTVDGTPHRTAIMFVTEKGKGLVGYPLTTPEPDRNPIPGVNQLLNIVAAKTAPPPFRR